SRVAITYTYYCVCQMVKPKTAREPPGKMDHTTSPPPEAHATTQAVLQKLELTLQSHTSQFERILQAILDTKTTLEAKIGSVTEDLNILRTDQHALADRVSELEKD
ncbi:hypothetical protein NDU88_000131, partial [Pleurodeles waltl]